MSLAAGTRLGPYEILASVGAGGIGEVYRARDPRLGREVALKVIAGDAAQDPERVRRFEQEAHAVAALDHPHVLAIHDVGTHDGMAYLVSELLEGETLRERLAQGRLPPRKAVELAVQTCQGLAAAHARGIVHRDLKPENLFVTRDGRVKILDFGLARLTEPLGEQSEETATRTRTGRGLWVGTPGYVSPEQLRGGPVDSRADLFALGAVLFEMVTGRRAFRGATSADTLSEILSQDPPPMALPEGRIVLSALFNGEPHLWLVEGPGTAPRLLAPGTWPIAVSPDGLWLATMPKPGTLSLIPLQGGDHRTIGGLSTDFWPIRFSGDGRSVFLGNARRGPCEIHRLDLTTERADLFGAFAPADRAGFGGCTGAIVSADGRGYVYGYWRSLADLVVAEGLR